LPFGTEALAVFCPLLIGRSPSIFRFCTQEFAKFLFSAPNAEKWAIDYEEMPSRPHPQRNTRATYPYERLAASSRPRHQYTLGFRSLAKALVIGDQNADLVANAESGREVKRIETAEPD